MAKFEDAAPQATRADLAPPLEGAAPNCPFFGCHCFPFARLKYSGQLPDLTFMLSNSDQCALFFERVTPCALKGAGRAVDWNVCPVLNEHRIDLNVRAHSQ